MFSPRLLLTLAATALLAVHAQNIDDNDIPNQCRDTCRPVKRLSDGCRKNNNGNDDFSNPGFAQCVCNSPTSKDDIVTCNNCVIQNLNYFTNANGNRQNYVGQWYTNCGYANGGGYGGNGFGGTVGNGVGYYTGTAASAVAPAAYFGAGTVCLIAAIVL
ncbi:Hypothetical predicted protein [Lecanosticta acicola]|uniref:Uncharacterized protein n=1 Tax=Lecanosticta acicola TaxID=111012 RepID=A0AAI8Z9A7_9PEZI|nr:Hypothetical predicted protein [Lecanosticta acicola]